MQEHTPPYRLVVIDRDPLAAHGLRTLVEQRFPALEIGAVYSQCALAEHQLAQHQPWVIVLDAELGGGAALALPRRLGCPDDGPACLARVEQETPEAIAAALQAGVLGVVMRCECLEEFLEALTVVACHLPYLSPLAGRIMAAGMTWGALDRRTDDGLPKLSAREAEIYHMLGRGMKTEAIVKQLGRSAKTVHTYYARLRKKLNLPDLAALVRHAILTQAARAPA